MKNEREKIVVPNLIDRNLIYNMRNRLRYSQSVLGEKIGRTTAWVNALECGRCTNVKIKDLQRIAVILGVSIHDILGGNND